MAQRSSTDESRFRRVLARLRGSARPRSDLRECPHCRRPFSCPIDWRGRGQAHWLVLLRCGNCGRRREVLVTNEEAAALESDVARDEHAIAREARHLDAERMRAQIDAFAAALARDLIDASDFAG